MNNRSETFGRLLKGAINSIATYEGKTAPIIEEELGAKIGLASTSIQRYKAGHLPPDPRTVEIIAEAAVQRGYLYREWLQRFLHAARYHQTDQLLDRLCPIRPARPRSPRAYQNLPAPTYSQFVMREAAFAEIVDGLNQRSAAVIVVGLGGNGKTSLAREVADRSIKSDDGVAPFDAAIWISDKDRPGTTNLSTVLDEIARTLDYPGFTQFEHDEKCREVEQLLRRQRVLVCVDNVETITDAGLIAWLLKLPEPSKTLLTTREYRREFRRGGWPVELRGMRDMEARALVDERLKVLRMERLVNDQTQLDPLVAATGGNPKAIEMTLGLVKYEHRPLQQLIDDLFSARGELFDDLFTRAWALLDEAARRILLVMTFFSASVGDKALAATADVQGFAFDRAVERLADLALLDVQQTELNGVPRYDLHPLVGAFARDKMAEQTAFEAAARERWIEWYITLASQVGYRWDDLSRLNLLDLEHENLFTVVLWTAQKAQHQRIIQPVRGARYYHYVHGLWKRAFELDHLRVEAAQCLNDVHSEVSALANCVIMASTQNQIELARVYLPRVYELLQTAQLPVRKTASLYEAIANYYMASNDLENARAAWETILGFGDALPPDKSIATRRRLATCLYRQGFRQLAQDMFHEALQDAKTEKIHRSIVYIQIQLAILALDSGDLKQAEMWLTATQERQRIYPSRDNQAALYRVYTNFHILRGDINAARIDLNEAIDLFERLGMRRELSEAQEQLRRLEIGEV